MKIVYSFAELLATPFSDGVNALCWPRRLPGDFDEIAAVVGPLDEITTVDDDSLRELPLSPAGSIARDILLADQKLLRDAGLDPSLDLVPAYPRDPDAGPVPIDVYSYHADSATVLADTWLCSYTESCSEGLLNEDAIRRVDDPATRAALLARYGGADDAAFAAWLHENCFDLHYASRPGALPYAFGLHNLWRIATECPGSLVPPCIHRAPANLPGRPARLLLIS